MVIKEEPYFKGGYLVAWLLLFLATEERKKFRKHIACFLSIA